MPYWWSKSCHSGQWVMNAPLTKYFRRRNRRTYIFSKVFFHKISCFLCFSNSIFYPRANGTFRTLFGGWFLLHRVDLSVREEDRLKLAMGLNFAEWWQKTLCLCQRKYDGFLCYFNIQSFENFRPWFEPNVGWGEPKFSQNCTSLKIKL